MDELWIRLGWNLILCVPFGILVWCLCQLPRIRTRPALRQGLWLLVLIKLVTPPLIPVPILSATGAAIHSESTATVKPLTQQGPPSTLSAPLNPTPVIDPLSNALTQSALSQETIAFAIPGKASTSIPISPWRTFATAAIFASLLVTVAIWRAALRELMRLQRLLGSNVSESDRASQMLAGLATQFRLKAIPELVIAHSPIAPVVWAGSRSVIVLSQQLIQSLDDDQLQHVLAHELAHLERRDHWTNLFAFFVATLFWWHPVTWIARRELGLAIELCCDALVLERRQGSRKSYAQTLLKIADFVDGQEMPRPALALNFDGTSSLRKRIQMIADPAVSARVSTGEWLLLIAITTTLLLLPVHAQDSTTPKRVFEGKAATTDGDLAPATQQQDRADAPFEKGKYYVTGTVFEEESRMPVANASVSFLIDAEQDPRKRVRVVSTDENGKFRFETPIGPVRLWHPKLKPGYWLNAQLNQMPGVTSVDKPIASMEIPVKRGVEWPIQIDVDGGVPEKTQFYLNIMEMEDDAIRQKAVNRQNWSLMKAANSSTSTLAADGKGVITQCGASGKLWITVQAMANSEARGKDRFIGSDIQGLSLEMLIDPAFDSSKVMSVTPIDKTETVQLTDENGAKTIIGQAQVTIQNGRPLLSFNLKRNPSQFTEQEFFGRVVDASGDPIADVKVSPAVGIVNGGSSQCDDETSTDQDGGFRLKLQMQESPENHVVWFIFMKDGYAAVDSNPLPLAEKPDGATDVGEFTLQPGHSIPVHVTDTDGHPLAGAVVEPLNSYASRQNAIRTDQEGRGQLRNLPAGIVSLFITYGEQSLQRKVGISLNDADNQELKLKLKPAAKPLITTVAPKRKEPIAIGSIAPELSIRSWIDGNEHRLADYRGRVVVLDFWGVWCSGCLRTIPLMRDLSAKYESKNVVFIAIHTPDGDYDEINRFRKLHDWKTLTGIENGQNQSDGQTSLSYGVRGFPTFIVIDADGKIAFNSSIEPKDKDAFMKEMENLAVSLEIPWPIPEKSEEDSTTYMNRIFNAKFSREIDRALTTVKN